MELAVSMVIPGVLALVFFSLFGSGPTLDSGAYLWSFGWYYLADRNAFSDGSTGGYREGPDYRAPGADQRHA